MFPGCPEVSLRARWKNYDLLTSDAGVVGDADAAVLVEGNRGDLAGASSAVLVVTVVPWHRIVIVVVDIGAGLVVVIQRQVGMIRLYPVVEDRHDDALAGVALLPGWAQIHVVAILGTAVLERMNRICY